MSKYKEPVILSEELIEYRDRIIEELKARTGAAVVNLGAFKERQSVQPHTIDEHQTVLEARVGNSLVRMVVSDNETLGGMPNVAIYYGFREITNRMMDALIKAGAQAP